MKPLPLAELRARCADLGLKTFRTSPLSEVSKDFGHDPATLDRVAAEHSAELAKRERRHRERFMARPDGTQSAYARAMGFDENGD